MSATKTTHNAEIFLTPEQVAEFTGIYGGNRDHSRSERQSAALKKMKVPHYINARGMPMVVRAALEGGARAATQAQPEPQWEPGLRAA